MFVPSIALQMFGNPVTSLNIFIISYNLSAVGAWMYMLNNPS
jgi:hypothetical protein